MKKRKPGTGAERSDGLYTRRKGAGKPRSDRGFWGVLAGALAVGILVPLCAILFSYYLKFQFEDFVSGLSNATVYAYEHGGMEVRDGETAYTLTGEDVYVPYFALSAAGMGKPEKTLPSGEKTMCFTYGNGARMQIWEVPMEDSVRGRDKGLAVWFEDADGSSYCYSTDRAFFSSLRNLCTTRHLADERGK